jgi:hypothetical protein
VEEGIVPGGGVALLRAQAVLKSFKVEDADEQIGVRIIERALEEPIRQISQNAGVEGSIVVAKVRDNESNAYGYNARTDEYEDLVQAGVIDPTKVTRTALPERRVHRRPPAHHRVGGGGASGAKSAAGGAGGGMPAAWRHVLIRTRRRLPHGGRQGSWAMRTARGGSFPAASCVRVAPSRRVCRRRERQVADRSS